MFQQFKLKAGSRLNKHRTPSNVRFRKIFTHHIPITTVASMPNPRSTESTGTRKQKNENKQEIDAKLHENNAPRLFVQPIDANIKFYVDIQTFVRHKYQNLKQSLSLIIMKLSLTN